jgi:hypothetical protein
MMQSQARIRLFSLIAIAIISLGALVATRVAARERNDHLRYRAVQRQYLRWLAYRVKAYAREHGRPAFHLDSVTAHMDSARAAEFRRNLIDIWGQPVFYHWDESRFILGSFAGTSRLRDRPYDSVRAAEFQKLTREQQFQRWMAETRRVEVREEYAWPPEARGRRNALGQYIK